MRWPRSASRARSIPTRVGISSCARGRHPLLPVHPHARGDLPVTDGLYTIVSGPSPRAWGSQVVRPDDSTRLRSIPTRVGISRWRGRSTAANPVHPHARGDLSQTKVRIGVMTGPSPRAWGSLEPAEQDPGARRSIPTRVGISPDAGHHGPHGAVHPHARGDLDTYGDCTWAGYGPSPRAWGSPGQTVTSDPLPRSIPTRVGISARDGRRARRAAVHPHARGDLSARHSGLAPIVGPSPRAWGSLVDVCVRHGLLRSIPTRVGIS